MGFDYKQIAEGARAFFNVGMEYWENEKRISGVTSIPYDCGSFVAKWYIAVMRKAVRTQKASVFRNCNSHFAANERK